MLGDIDPIGQTYLLDDYLADVARHGVEKGVHVQCADGPADRVLETRWLQEIADATGWPQAIVPYVDLQGPSAQRDLERQVEFANVRGIRDLVIGRPFMWADARFRDNVRSLGRFGLHYELRALPSELADACGLVAAVPDVPMVLTHAGLPIDRDQDSIANWKRGMRELGRCENVVCKLSAFGMMDHMAGEPTTVSRTAPFVETCLETFGPDRLMFGGNWPVDSLSCDYGELLAMYRACLGELSEAELTRVFETNAEEAYRI
jgi:predicted TIM-barrel fold metal-dependent hydrolase